MLKEYSLISRYQNNCAFKTVSIDKEALEAEREKFLNDPNYTLVDEIKATDTGRLTYQNLTSQIPGVDFIKGRAVFLGEMHTDSRCTGTRPLYTMPELKDKAIKEMELRKKGQEAAADAYYSKVWV
jgi:hypothetical protein